MEKEKVINIEELLKLDQHIISFIYLKNGNKIFLEEPSNKKMRKLTWIPIL